MSYKSDVKFPEIKTGVMSFCHVDPAGGVPCRVHVHPVKASSVKTANVDGFKDNEIVDDPDDDIISINEYVSAFSDRAENKPKHVIDEKLARKGKILQWVGQAFIAVGTISGMSLGFVFGPVAGFAIAMAGMGIFLGFTTIGERLKRKAGMTKQESRELPV